MQIYLQTHPGADHAPRYCHLLLQEDLLTGWTLTKESGHQGSAGRVTRLHFDHREQAQTALMAARDTQLKRGYRIVFVKGEQAPT